MTADAILRPEAAVHRALAVLDAETAAPRRIDALHDLARARVELGAAGQARPAVAAAIRLATRARLTGVLPELRLTLAWIELDTGRVAAGLRQLDSVSDDPRALCLRGMAACASGDQDTAERMLSDAVDRLDDRHWLANALAGRGIVRCYRSRLAAADADFAVAQALRTEAGAHERAAACVHNRGFVALRAGDLPGALRLFDDAERAGLRTTDRAEALVDRAGALLAAGLVDTAGEVLDRAARLLGAAGRGASFAEATLTLARCALLRGATDQAVDAAGTAVQLFRAQRRPGWSAVAGAIELRARLVAEPRLAGRAPRVAARCRRAGWRVEAAELLLTAAAVAGAPAAALLAEVEPERHAEVAALRAAGWLARARLATGARGVLAACRAGLRVVDEQVALMGSVELQSGVAALGGALAETGLRAALATRDARRVLAWTDRCRTADTAVRPPEDPLLAADLTRLRAARHDLVRTAEVERQVRRRALTAPGHRGSAPAALAVPELLDRLGEHAMISFVTCGNTLYATSAAGSVVRLHDLGPDALVRAEVARLRFALAVRQRSGRGGDAARTAARVVDDRLLRPLRGRLGDRPLVLVPTGWLHGLPWAALPSCAARPVSVAPSARAWLHASGRPAPDGPVVWLAGPGLRHAVPEVTALHRRFGGTLRTGATAAEALTALDGAGIAHVAAHGEHRADAPLFSGLTFADGPLYGYDLDRLGAAPRVLVLSACDAALGLASVVLRRGTTAVIASSLPVPDDAAAALTATLHTELHAGRSPAAALAAAQHTHGHHGFTCLGAG